MKAITPRQRHCLQLAACGLNNYEIASKLYVTHNTVKTTMWHLYKKLGVHDRAHAVAIGIRRGLIY